MSEKNTKNPFLDENFNPKKEDSENDEAKQVEENVLSTDLENANLPSTLDSLSSDKPTFDIVLSQLALEVKGNQIATPKSAADKIAAFESTWDQMADLEKAAEMMAVSESVADQKADSESAADQKADSESAADQKAGSESAADQKADSESAADQKADSESVMNLSLDSLDGAFLELPPTPRVRLIYRLMMEQYPALLDEGTRLRDIYGITSIRDEILLDMQNRFLFIIYDHRINDRSTNLAKLLSECLITEVKRLYSQGLIENLILEGDINDYFELIPAPEQHGKMMCATLVLGFALLAFGNYTCDGRENRIHKLAEKCRVAGVPLPHEPQYNPMHPWARWLQCVSISYEEMKLYLQTLQDAINYFSSRNLDSINKELGITVQE